MKRLLIFTFLLCNSFILKAIDSTKVEIHFSFNQYKLTTAATTSLDSILNTFNNNTKTIVSIDIAGHTDQIGSHFYNNNLSLKRANAAQNYLLKKNIDSGLIKTIFGFGKQQLLTNAIENFERLKNRRIVITFVYATIIDTHITQPIQIIDSAKSQKQIINPPKKIKETLEDTAIKVGDKIELPYILFIGGQHEFLSISYPYLDELFYALKNNPTLEIEIQGHICCAIGKEDGIDFGTGKNNLSVARARAVYDFLVKSGIDANRLNYKGFGHQFPLTKERTEQEQTRNRRVEIKIIKR